MRAYAQVALPWSDPVAALGRVADQPWAIGFLSGGSQPGARWSYVAAEPAKTLSLRPIDEAEPFAALAELAGPVVEPDPNGPPFQGGVAGLACYELADRLEALRLPRLGRWPDLAAARYPAVLAFDHAERRVLALGRGAEPAEAEAAAARAAAWLDLPAPAPKRLDARLEADDPAAYEAAVADVVRRIGEGEIFQANIARRWRGRLAAKARPFDLLAALAADSPAPFAAYLRLRDRVVISNSPERFVQAGREGEGLLARTEPIKGTAPRGADPAADAAQAAALAASEKDRAENLMIVDLMRNDLSRVCRAGGVAAPELFTVATFANVHHLVSTVTGRLAEGRSALDLLAACFPPGSITGAPKVQAMKVIAGHEAPRGPFFGSMFLLGADGTLDSNVLIRTAAFTLERDGWHVEARAGAGIVADSIPALERQETEAKISALAAALGGAR
ncbi:anthranilate synthase component I family protein [Phenylobacterium soli]|uniref:Aminodeoxychorismate synthase component I n=1 Tax=Phenylobacterium soli TaxID=2170551 RepID=A0A328AKF9_9CAUL|nr:anthranilate synthase component I family protein [Phenylobacterium soli]RAK55007.1 aminodeoxychorismate synthase component I [Phenylobacterium soli]